MWVSQTYLGEAPKGAFCFVYYFFEDYDRDQKAYTDEIQPYLSRLGLRLGHHVHLYGPNPIGHENVSQEIFDKFSNFSRNFHGQLPGIFICQKPLSEFKPEKDESVFLTLVGQDAECVLAKLEEVIANQRIHHANEGKGFNLFKYLANEFQYGIQIGPFSMTKK